MTRTNIHSIKVYKFLQPRYLLSLLSICVTIYLLIWSFANYQPNPNIYGPRAMYSLIFLSIALALSGRIILIRMLRSEIARSDISPYDLRSTWRLLFLIEITAPLYLAAGVLIGAPAAVLLAIITQVSLQVFTFLQRYVSWQEACFSVAGIALIAFISSFVYRWIAGPPINHVVEHFQPITESKEFVGSILAATVMMILLLVFSISFIMLMNRTGLRAAW